VEEIERLRHTPGASRTAATPPSKVVQES
jgi:hypothetical protein